MPKLPTNDDRLKLFLGLDPGKFGSIVIIDENKKVIFKSVVPKVGNEYDKKAAFKLLEEYKDRISHAVLEDVHAIPGSSAPSTFDFGRGKMLWECALEFYDIPHTLVSPKTWQKEMWQGIPLQMKSTKREKKNGDKVKKVDTKETSKLAAMRIFPGVDLKRTDRCSEPDEGIVDGILMAEYARRKFK